MFDAAILEKWLAVGLCRYKGNGRDSVCVEQAVALALGLGTTDHPDCFEESCISPVIADIKRDLNDCMWSSPAARSSGLRALAYEQLGSRGINEEKFLSRLRELYTKRIMSKYLSTYPEMVGVCKNLDLAYEIAKRTCLPAISMLAHIKCGYLIGGLPKTDEYLLLFAEIMLEALREAKYEIK